MNDTHPFIIIVVVMAVGSVGLFGCAKGTASPPENVDVVDEAPDPMPESPEPDPFVPDCQDADEDGAAFGVDCVGELLDCDDFDARRRPDNEELCDGVDNDCDKEVDEALSPPACRLTQGVCAGSVKTCKGESGFVECTGADYGGAYVEVEDGGVDSDHCDGVDNDCDGLTDEGCPCQGDEVILCGTAVGECERGLQHCMEGQWGPCEQVVEPTGELCDGLDNDCDGEFDESLEAPSCSSQMGVCAGSRQVCLGLAGWSICAEAEYGSDWAENEDPEAEGRVCDGLDNDCDGLTDEGCDCVDGELLPCGSDVGACSQGIQTCRGGRYGDCRGAIEATDEVCDGLDNDCDGERDEGLEIPGCELQQGVCQGSRQVCGGLDGWLSCSGVESFGERYRTLEDPEVDGSVCDGQDNDCDGLTDEGCECVDGDIQACGSNIGLCEMGLQTCSEGRFGACDGEVLPVAEVCNGDDDDCDAEIDEGLVAPDCALTLGVCAGAVKSCLGDLGFGVCAQAQYGPAWEVEESTCDRRDNDCDGEVDEGCECVDGDIQRCGSDEGACESGAQTCAQGQWGPCEGEVIPVDEVCDGVDSDCDGEIDEGLVAPDCALTLGVCAGAVEVCGGEAGWLDCEGPEYGVNFDAGEETTCDGLDNDCDAQIDEQCECLPADVQVCGSEIGACEQGVQRCVEGVFGACEGEVGSVEEVCDGLDNDCDTQTDEDLIEDCARQLGVCEGATVACEGGAFAECDEVQYGPRFAIFEGILECDGLDNDCDGLVDELCGPPSVVISELLYDEEGQDTGRSLFIELTGPPLARLGGLRLEAINGNGGQIIETIVLPNDQLPFNGVYLIVGEEAGEVLKDQADLVIEDVDLQNGPDSLRLVWNAGTEISEVVDAVGYGRFGEGEVFAGEGASASEPQPGHSLTRDADATDTGDNATDFMSSAGSVEGVPTPGGGPLPDIHVRLTWDTEGDDLDLHFQRSGALFGGSGDCYWLNRNPDWGQEGLEIDDPRLDRDDFDGLGPEIIDLVRPAVDTYLVQVHVWEAQQPLRAVATIFVEGGGTPGVDEFSFSLELPGTDTFWAVAEILVSSEGIVVTPRGEVGEEPFTGP